MFEENKILAMIPARGGSKDIKDKNIYPLCGKPLIAYTIEAALNSKYLDDVIVSTDSEKIADVAKNFGAEVPFLRPPELASDTSKTIDAILHVITELKKIGRVYDDFILLQPTSPLRTSENIDNAIEKYFKFGRKSLVSISKVNDSPIFMRTIISEDRMKKVLELPSTVRRQDLPDFYRVNGAIYINKISEIDEQTSFNDNEVPFLMSPGSSVEVDEYKDLEIVKFFLQDNCGSIGGSE